MGIDFRVIWAADFDYTIRFYLSRPSRRPTVTRRPPAVTQKFKRYDRFIVMGIDFGVIWAADFNNTIIFYVRHPARRPRVTRCPPSHQN